jgi:hypothetical protein
MVIAMGRLKGKGSEPPPEAPPAEAVEHMHRFAAALGLKLSDDDAEAACQAFKDLCGCMEPDEG